MTHYHLDCASGLAGDMFLGACLDLGMPLDLLTETVARLGLSGISVESRKALRGGVTGTRFRVLESGRPIEGPDPDEAHEHALPHDPTHEHHEHDAHPRDRGHVPHSPDSHSHEHPHAHPHDPTHEHHEHDAHPRDRGHVPHSPDHSHDHHDHHHGRDLASIRRMITESGLAAPVKERAIRLFQRLGEAEAKIHGMEVDSVHFHEVGAVDSIVDLVGAAAAIEFLA